MGHKSERRVKDVQVYKNKLFIQVHGFNYVEPSPPMSTIGKTSLQSKNYIMPVDGMFDSFSSSIIIKNHSVHPMVIKGFNIKLLKGAMEHVVISTSDDLDISIDGGGKYIKHVNMEVKHQIMRGNMIHFHCHFSSASLDTNLIGAMLKFSIETPGVFNISY